MTTVELIGGAVLGAGIALCAIAAWRVHRRRTQSQEPRDDTRDPVRATATRLKVVVGEIERRGEEQLAELDRVMAEADLEIARLRKVLAESQRTIAAYDREQLRTIPLAALETALQKAREDVVWDEERRAA